MRWLPLGSTPLAGIWSASATSAAGGRQRLTSAEGGAEASAAPSSSTPALRSVAAAAGVEVFRLAGCEVVQSSQEVRVRTLGPGHTPGPDMYGRYLLAADGLHSPTRRSLGLKMCARGPQRFGQRRHYHLRPWSSHVEVHSGSYSEAYVTPVGADLVGVAVLSARRVPFEEQLNEFPQLRERLANASAATRARGAGPLRQRAVRRVAGRVLLVGDAGGVRRCAYR